MWTRSLLKERAKETLKGSYWKALGVSLVLGFVSGGGASYSYNTGANNYGYSNSFDVDPAILITMLIAFVSILAVIVVVSLVLKIFVFYALEVGCQKYFVDATDMQFNMNHLGFGFKKGNYMSIIKGMIWKDLFIFLWSLLLVIPGIIASYAYKMVPYILAENPDITYKEAIEMSKKMTRNQKFDIFVLDLSFIGWYILGFLACFIGVIFVMPYYYSTQAQLYKQLKDNAISAGVIDASAFGVSDDEFIFEK